MIADRPVPPEVAIADTTCDTIILTLDHSSVCYEDHTFHYEISWRREDGKWSDPVATSKLSYTIAGLHPATEYRVRVFAVSTEDPTVVSEPLTVRAVTLAGIVHVEYMCVCQCSILNVVLVSLHEMKPYIEMSGIFMYNINSSTHNNLLVSTLVIHKIYLTQSLPSSCTLGTDDKYIHTYVRTSRKKYIFDVPFELHMYSLSILDVSCLYCLSPHVIMPSVLAGPAMALTAGFGMTTLTLLTATVILVVVCTCLLRKLRKHKAKGVHG